MANCCIVALTHWLKTEMLARRLNESRAKRLNFVFCLFFISEHESLVNEGIPVDVEQTKRWEAIMQK